jgi:glycosyltransferase involved in cell wall biosynthesis
MKKLSVTIITFNEVKNIARCLDSVIDFADEIIVVDSFSTDSTKDICKGKNVRFFENKFEGYSAQKNFANSLSENEYILSLDADEAVSVELKQSIIEEKSKNFPQKAYHFNRLMIYCGKSIKCTDWYPDKKIRLWHKDFGSWNNSIIHEKLELKPEIKSFYLKGDLLHYSFNSVEEHINQSNKFSKIAAEQLILRNKKNLFLKMIFSPLFKFIKNYFLKLGIFGGFNGFLISALISYETFLKYAKAVHRKHFTNEKSA